MAIKINLYLQDSHGEIIEFLAESMDKGGIRGVYGSDGKVKKSVVMQVLLEATYREMTGEQQGTRSMWRQYEWGPKKPDIQSPEERRKGS